MPLPPAIHLQQLSGLHPKTGFRLFKNKKNWFSDKVAGFAIPVCCLFMVTCQHHA